MRRASLAHREGLPILRLRPPHFAPAGAARGRSGPPRRATMTPGSLSSRPSTGGRQSVQLWPTGPTFSNGRAALIFDLSDRVVPSESTAPVSPIPNRKDPSPNADFPQNRLLNRSDLGPSRSRFSIFHGRIRILLHKSVDRRDERVHQRAEPYRRMPIVTQYSRGTQMPSSVRKLS